MAKSKLSQNKATFKRLVKSYEKKIADLTQYVGTIYSKEYYKYETYLQGINNMIENKSITASQLASAIRSLRSQSKGTNLRNKVMTYSVDKDKFEKGLPIKEERQKRTVERKPTKATVFSELSGQFIERYEDEGTISKEFYDKFIPFYEGYSQQGQSDDWQDVTDELSSESFESDTEEPEEPAYTMPKTHIEFDEVSGKEHLIDSETGQVIAERDVPDYNDPKYADYNSLLFDEVIAWINQLPVGGLGGEIARRIPELISEHGKERVAEKFDDLNNGRIDAESLVNVTYDETLVPLYHILDDIADALFDERLDYSYYESEETWVPID